MLVVAVLLSALATACAPSASESGTDARSPNADVDGAEPAHGTLVVYTMTFDEGAGYEQYFLRTAEREVPLHFAAKPDVLPGTPIRVWGEPQDDGLRVDRYEVEREIGVNVEPLTQSRAQPIDGMRYEPRSFAFVLVDTGRGVNITKEEAEQRLFSTNPEDKSVKHYYNEASYGTQDIVGDVIGPLEYRMLWCDTYGLASTLRRQIDKEYDHYLWYIGSRNLTCGFSGLAEGGQPDEPTRDTWYNASAGCVVLVQEPGHNFGMMHSSSMNCGDKPFADDPDATCSHSEYGDRYDPMGGACNHMNAWQKVFQGWLQECNALKLHASGMYTLQPLELACDGPQVLQIPMPKVRPFGRNGGGGLPTVENIGFYYLELRTARGFDDTIRIAPTILLHVAEDYRSRSDYGRHSWILDTDPSTETIDGLGMGQSFTDPAGGVSFEVVALSQDSATIQVTIPDGTGDATCLDDTTYDPAVPRTCAGIVGTDGKLTETPGDDTQNVAPPRVEAFILVDADTQQDIMSVEDTAVLDLDQLPPNLTMRVVTDPPVVGSVVFRIDGGAPSTDNMTPYSLTSGGASGDFTPWMLDVGAHTTNATPFEAADGGGRQGEPFEIDFMLTRSSSVGPDGVPSVGVPPTAGMLAVGMPAAGMGGVTPGSALTSAPAASAGTSARVNAINGSAGAGALAAPATTPVAPVEAPAESGCSCRVVGVGSGANGTRGAWAVAALALGLLLRRRRTR